MQPDASSQVNNLGGVLASPGELKPGIRSTEFWITLLLIAVQMAMALKGLIPPEHAAVYAMITGAIYKVLRAGLKAWHGQLDVETLYAMLDELQAARSTVSSSEMPSPPVMAGPTASSGSSARVGSESGFAVSDFLFALVMAFLVAMVVVAFSGCAQTDRAIRSRVESVEGYAKGTYDPATKASAVRVGGRIYFRDPADSKAVKPLGLRDETDRIMAALPAGSHGARSDTIHLGQADSVLVTDLGAALPPRFRLDLETMDQDAERALIMEGAPFALVVSKGTAQ
jgi:hypothetical protein